MILFMLTVAPRRLKIGEYLRLPRAVADQLTRMQERQVKFVSLSL